ncbi:HAD family hydrolase, partial [Candidatus Roizmanbacteria bacterium]|nr:HAD family hydrolase [Candidatus Roizmanbacteria bacterium]
MPKLRDHIILFDIDGTLFDTQAFGRLVFPKITKLIGKDEKLIKKVIEEYFSKLDSGTDFHPGDFLNHLSTRFSIDLKLLNDEITDIFPTVRLHMESKNSKGILENREIRGISHCLHINSVALGRLQYVLGAPQGDKVKQVLALPKWVFSLEDNLKEIFLGVLWSTEGSKPLRTKKDKNTGGYNLYFTMAKDIRLISHHIKFLNQIRMLFKEAGIETTEVKLGTTKTKRK